MKTDDEWQSTLSPKQYQVLREHGTEMRGSSGVPFTACRAATGIFASRPGSASSTVGIADFAVMNYTCHLGSNFIATPFIQYRWPVGFGPSSNTWPRCPPHLLQCTSVRVMKRLRSSVVPTAPGIGS